MANEDLKKAIRTGKNPWAKGSQMWDFFEKYNPAAVKRNKKKKK